MIKYQNEVSPGPVQGTPPPPTVKDPGADQGGRPPTSSNTPDLGATMAKWRSGIFTPPPPAASMAQARPQTAASGQAPITPGMQASLRPPAGRDLSGVTPTEPTPGGGIPGAPGRQLPPGVSPGQTVPGTGIPGSTTLPHVPQPHEVDALHPGIYETPIGTLSKGADGTARYTLNEQGQALYRQRYADSVQAFGPHPFQNDPNAPPPPVTPGGISYNPFTNRYTDSTPKPPGIA